jgi:hypothetical protein
MLLTKLTYGSVTNVTATGELGGLFLPLAIGYQTAFIGGSSAGFSKATYATYDEANYINKVMVTPPAFAVPCRAATTANISLSGLQTMDGVVLIAGDRALVKDQTTATQNGIYTVASGSWSRPFDSDTGAELQVRSFFKITSGTVNADYYAVIQNTGTITVGTTVINYDLVLDPVLLESQTVYWLRFKDMAAAPQYYATDTNPSTVVAKLATTANITLNGNQTIDGVLTGNNNIVIVKNQTTTSENGLYYASSGAWTIYPYLIGYESLPWLLYVTAGTVNGGRTFASSRTVAYTPFAVYTNIYTLISMILYPTLADATAETNALIPAYKTAFNIEWITKPYTPIGCVEMAAANVADIYCCPAPTEYLQTFPDHVEIIFPTETIVARLFNPDATLVSTYDSAIYSGINGINFFHYEYDAAISCSGVPRTNTRRFFWFRIASFGGGLQAQIMKYVLDAGASVCAAYFTYYTDYFYNVWRSNELYYYETGPAAPFTFYQTTPHSWASYDYTVSPNTFSSGFIDPLSPTLSSFDIQYAQTIPPTITCYLVNAVFQRTTVDIPSGDDIALGTISVTLTYDAASSTYYGPVANYYNIPGRLSMPAGLLPTVASGGMFLNTTLPNWKVNSSNQIYYEKYLSAGAPSNEISLFYSGYSDARKPTPATSEFYKTDSFSVYTNTNGSLLRSDPTTQTATP